MKTSTLQLRKLSILFIFLLGSWGSASAQTPLTLVGLTPLTYNGGVNIRCYGQSNGRAIMNVTGGVAPYTYLWSFGTTTNLVGGSQYNLMPAGPFSVTVIDATGASVTASGVLTQNPPIDVTASWTPILCYGGTSTVTVTPTAGTAPYSGIQTYNNVAPGSYNYFIADANGCRDNYPIVIGQPPILEATVTRSPILCYGDSSEVNIGATGGVAPYVGTGLYTESAGVFTYLVTDANGCSDDIVVGINEPGQMSAAISNTPILCNGGTSQVTVTVMSGTEPYTGTGVFTEYAGYHTYTVYDFNGCSDTIGIAISEPTELSASASATAIGCAGGTSNVTVTGTGGTAPYSGTGVFPVTAGTHPFTVTDANGCTATTTVTVNQSATTITLVGVPANATAECGYIPSPATVMALGSNGSVYNVTFAETTVGSGCSYQIVRTWTATDECGAQTVGTQTLTVQDTQGPDFLCPANFTIDCNNPFIPISAVNVQTFDCSAVTMTVNDVVVNGAGTYVNQKTIYRTYTATDACGNVSTCTQVITGTPVLTEGSCSKCDSEIKITVDPFNPSCVYVKSCKNLSNVVLGDVNGWEFKFDGLTGYTAYFCHPSGLALTDVWVKSGCFRSGDGPGYGHHFGVCGPAAPSGYDPSAGLNTNYEWIDQVVVGAINNTSGNNNGYANFTTIATSAPLGSSVNVQLTPGFATTTPETEYWRMWIDYNDDGDFLDLNEMVFQNNSTTTVSGSFVIPQTATVNTDLRMRIAMKYSAYSESDEIFQYGEVEDYTIYVQTGPEGIHTTIGAAGKGSDVERKSATVSQYPNPAETSSTFEFTVPEAQEVTLSIVGMTGELIANIYNDSVDANRKYSVSYDVSELQSGIYFVYLTSNEGTIKEKFVVVR
jgi:hypothetical protein